MDNFQDILTDVKSGATTYLSLLIFYYYWQLSNEALYDPLPQRVSKIRQVKVETSNITKKKIEFSTLAYQEGLKNTDLHMNEALLILNCYALFNFLELQSSFYLSEKITLWPLRYVSFDFRDNSTWQTLISV